MTQVGLEVVQGTDIVKITHDGFDGYLTCRVPESVGDADGGIWTHDPRTFVRPEWTQGEDGCWEYSWHFDGLLRYSVKTEPGEDWVDFHLTLQNLQGRAWEDSYAFPCVKTHTSPQFTDYEGSRTLLRVDGEYVPITKLPRKNSPRPTLQFWYVGGEQRILGVVEVFDASSEVRPDGLIAVRSWDRRHFLVLTSDNPLFLFSDLESSRVCCCPGFGRLEPGQTGEAVNRVRLLPDTKLSDLDALISEQMPGVLHNP